MTAPAPELVETGSDRDDLSHAACPCTEDVALCGADVSDAAWTDDCPDLAYVCVVCLDLVDQPCPRCGL